MDVEAPVLGAFLSCPDTDAIGVALGWGVGVTLRFSSPLGVGDGVEVAVAHSQLELLGQE